MIAGIVAGSTFKGVVAGAIVGLVAQRTRSLGVLDKTGTLEAGKMADVVLWNANPFSVYAKAEQVYIDGARVQPADADVKKLRPAD